MEKFRVLSDIHLDVNKNYPFELKDKNIFTVICGDTSGTPKDSIEWIMKNCPNGVGVSGNHLPYNNLNKTIQELREELKSSLSESSSFTYLDVETGTFYKEIDGILFIGTCMYTDMCIKHEVWNPTGDKELNMKCSRFNMNDYKWGIKHKILSDDSNICQKIEYVDPLDYFMWFKNAYSAIDKKLDENESSECPLPVVLITHHPLIMDFFGHNGYVEDVNYIYRPRDFNWASYASNMKMWIKRHTSINCYCCGHIHDVYNGYRHFYIERDDNTKCLVVNNARGYVYRGQDFNFNPNLYVKVGDWTIVEDPLSDEEMKKRKQQSDKIIKNLAWLI